VILVDTSVWIRHLKIGNPRLRKLLLDEQVIGHPFVIGELACGNLSNRGEILGLLQALPQAPLAEHDEALGLVESRKLHGRGIGWIDVHLLTSALLSGARLWTLDKALHRAAADLGVAMKV
jgi:predicted nucleic acid-binding protein